jgi:hypothetical protein
VKWTMCPLCPTGVTSMTAVWQTFWYPGAARRHHEPCDGASALVVPCRAGWMANSLPARMPGPAFTAVAGMRLHSMTDALIKKPGMSTVVPRYQCGPPPEAPTLFLSSVTNHSAGHLLGADPTIVPTVRGVVPVSEWYTLCRAI